MSFSIKSSMIILALSALTLSACSPKGFSTTEKRDAIRTIKNDTVQRLLDEHPSAGRKLIDGVGYAVFSSKTAKFIFAGAGVGYGVAVNNETNKETFMKMAEVSAGFGIGASDVRAVFIFHHRETFDDFLSKGLEFGVNADAALVTKENGGLSKNGELPIGLDPIIYVFTENGVELSASIAGTKYWPYYELNY